MGTEKEKTKIQTLMCFKPAKEREIEGIGMGVLEDGTAYLTARGLARMCGVDHTKILILANEWEEEQFKPRGRKIADLLQAREYDQSNLFIQIEVGGQIHHAFSATVCLALLEYYAFYAGPNCKEHARSNYRLFAGKAFDSFIYVQVGYDPRNRIPEAWTQFQDRVSLVYNNAPAGYFSIFKEVADMVVAMIHANVPVGEKTVPDLSVGGVWGRHWTKMGFDARFGDRIKYEHNYPEYFSQAVSNPQEAWAYPDASLAEFRKWMRETYLPEKFPVYLQGQIAKHNLLPSVAMLALSAVGASDRAPEQLS